MIRLVAGLGNIGETYTGTRHNAGFAVVDRLLTSSKGTISSANGTSYRGWKMQIGSESLLLIKPSTYMNLSGLAVAEAIARHVASIDELLVIVDEFQLPVGATRLRQGGSDGGHNGLKSIIQTLESQEFARLRLGVGPLLDGVNTADFVLSRFPDEDHAPFAKAVDIAAEAVILAVRQPLATVMSFVNRNPAPPN